MKIGLVWFKNDLRLLDNESLCQAIAQCDQLVLWYCVESYQYNKLDLGFKKADCNRFKFLEESVKTLQKNLKSINADLIITSNGAVQDLPELVEKYNITAVFAEEEYAPEELATVREVQNLLPKISFNFYWGKTLYHKDDIPFSIDKIPLTSKAYRIPATQESKPRTTFKIPDSISQHEDVCPTEFPSYRLFDFSDEEYQNATPFVDGGEDKALSRLRYYTFESQLLTGYRWTRNQSLGLDYSSKFSPYLTLGCISPRTIFEAVKEYEVSVKKNASTWWIIFEIVWRDYFTFKQMRFGAIVFFSKGIKNKELAFENDPVKFERWQKGTTGIPFIDAHMRQLNTTGYMSNRGRVNCASYFVHDLKIDWTWGAAYFESKLIDYDVSANWLNWHMQAFEIYYTNPVHQSLKYKANEFIAKWIPELESITDNRIHAPWMFPELLEQSAYPEPIDVYKKWSRSINNIVKSV